MDPEVQKALEEMAKAIQELAIHAVGSSDGLDRLSRSTNNLSDAQKEEIRLKQISRVEAQKRAALDAEIDRMKTQAQQNGIRAVESFTNALFSGQKGFEKYGKTLDAAGDAVLAFTKTMGPLGQVMGVLIKGATMVGSAHLKQADNVLKASDDLAKMGGAGGQTAKELLEMGHRAGLTSKNLDAFIKPLKSMGSGIVALGDNVGAGTKVFAKMAEVSSDTRMKFQRLGVSQEELLQSQADYVRLQQLSGRNLQDQTKDAKKLQASSLAYTENLLLLASLSGKDIETIKKEQELALSREETLIQTLRTENEIARLKKSGRPEDLQRAESLKKELDARDKLLQGIQTQVGDEKLGTAMAKFLATGAITEESKFLKTMGVPLEEFHARIKKGEDVTGDFLNSLKNATIQKADEVGLAATFNKEAREAYGLQQKMLQFAAGRRDIDENKAREKSKAELAAAEKAGHDKLQDSRAQLLEAERFLAIGMDELLLKTNFLFNGFDSATTAVLALQAAALLAAGVLGAKGIAGAIGKAKDLASLAKGAIPAATTAAPAAAGTATAGLAVAGAKLAAAGAAGYVAGKYIANPLLDAASQKLTGNKEASFGTGLYELADKLKGISGLSDKDIQQKVDLDSKIALGVKRMAEGQTISKDMADTLKKAGKDISTAKIAGEKAADPTKQPEGAKAALTQAEIKAKEDAAKVDNIKKGYAEKVKKLEAEHKAKLEAEKKQAKVTAPKAPETKDAKDVADQLVKKGEQKELSPELVMFNKMLEQVTKNLGNVNLNFTKFDTTLKDINTEFGLDLAGFDDKKSTELRDELKRTRDDIVRKFREVSGTAAPAASSGGGAPTSGGTAAGPSAAPSTAAPTSGTYSPGTTPVPKPESGAPGARSGAPAGAGPGATETGKKYPSDGLEQVKKAGLKVRPYGDVYQGGPLTDNAVDVALALQNLPGFQFFTGLNDAYHIKKHPSSQHAKGRGIDFTVDPKYQSIEETTKLKKMISSISGVSKVLNEYYPPSQGGDANQFTTGGHFHVNVAKEGGIFDGPETGYPVMQHGTELTAPLDKDSILMKMAKTAGEVEDIAKLVTEPPDTPNDSFETESMLREMSSNNSQIYSMIAEKLDQVISILNEGNDTSNKLLKYSMV